MKILHELEKSVEAHQIENQKLIEECEKLKGNFANLEANERLLEE